MCVYAKFVTGKSLNAIPYSSLIVYVTTVLVCALDEQAYLGTSIRTIMI